MLPLRTNANARALQAAAAALTRCAHSHWRVLAGGAAAKVVPADHNRVLGLHLAFVHVPGGGRQERCCLARQGIPECNAAAADACPACLSAACSVL
jgi:hypothetical protein